MNAFSIIVAMDNSHGIGINNQLPWQLKGDMAHFRQITTTTESPHKKNALIMGRKTWESIPEKFRPLPGRQNIILTHSNSYTVPEGVFIHHSLDDALRSCEELHRNEHIEHVFIIGGSTIYKEAIAHPACKTLYITEVLSHFKCDAFFPDFKTLYNLDSQSEIHQEKELSYRFCIFKKNV